MLSSVLNSEQAIQTNIQIMRVFTRIRQMVIDNAEVWKEIADIKIEQANQARSQDSQSKNIKEKGTRVEFKVSQGGIPLSFYDSVYSFLNREGGVILLGVKDDGTVVGLDEPQGHPGLG